MFPPLSAHIAKGGLSDVSVRKRTMQTAHSPRERSGAGSRASVHIEHKDRRGNFMTPRTFLRWQWLGPFAMAGLIVLLFAGAFTVARAQSQVCRDVGNLSVCGDQVAQENQQGEYRLRGNIRIGPKGGP